MLINAVSGNIFLGRVLAQHGSAMLTAGTGDVVIGFVSAANDVLIETPQGSITELQDDALVDIEAGGTVALTAFDRIGAFNPMGTDTKLELADGTSITASTTVGDIELRGLGAVTLSDLQTADGAITVMASGDIAVGLVDTSGMDSNLNDVTITTDFGNILVQRVRAGRLLGDVTLEASGGIIDADAVPDDVDIEGDHVTLIATLGIGNTNALETDAGSMLAFNTGPVGDILIQEIGSGGNLVLSQVTNRAAAGSILVDVLGGSLTVAGLGAHTTSGHITLTAQNDILVQASVTAADVGSIFVRADNSQDGDAPAAFADGISLHAEVASANGDILLSSAKDIEAVTTVSSTNGNIGLLSGGSLKQTGQVHSDADVLVVSKQDIDMSPAASTMGQLVSMQAGGSVGLGLVSAVNVSVEAGQNITDRNGPLDTNVRADSLRIVAGDRIGDADGLSPATENKKAIDIEVLSVAARSANGIYLQQFAAGGDLTIQQAPSSTATITLSQLEADGQVTMITESVTNSGVSDLTTSSGGPIKVAVRDGSLIIQDGSDGNGRGVHAVGAGDVLLWASQDIVTQASITSGSGHITLQAGDDIDLNAPLSTGGAGSVYLFAGNAASDASSPEVDGINVDGTIGSQTGDLLLSSQQDIRFTQDIRSGQGHVGLLAGGDMLQLADVTTDGDVWLRAGGSLSMTGGTTTSAGATLLLQSGSALELGSVTAQQVALQAGGDILDHNGADVVNVQSSALSMTAGGMIGHSDTGQPNPEVNAQALDLQVTTVAALSSSGIYLQQLTAGGDLTVGTVAPVGVSIAITQPRFNSSSDSVPLFASVSRVSDLTTSSGGPIKVAVRDGSLIIQDGSDGNGRGVHAVGAGDVLLWASQDIVTQASITSGSGHITLQAGDDIDLNASTEHGRSR